MKNQLFTRNFFLGILIPLVLVFSLLGTPADALKFSRSSPSSSGDLQTVFANRDFKISFSVSSGSNTTPIKNSSGKLVDASNADPDQARRIDSSGYLVTDDIGGRTYRNITTNPTGTLVIDPRPTYSTNPDGSTADPDAAGTPDSSAYYVDTSRNVVDADGKAVYVQTGGGTRADNSDPQNPVAANPWRYTRAKADPTPKIVDSLRYHYNQEALNITIPTNLTLKKINTYTVNLDASNSPHTMDEAKNSVNEDKISSSISLTYTASAVGTYDIIISDETPPTDRPGAEAPDLVFRVFVVKDIGAVQNVATNFEGRDGVDYGYDTQDWQLNDNDTDTNIYFDFDTEDAPVTYSVEGSGRVYIKLGDRVTSLTKTLHTSSDAPVYLDMSGGTNKVTAYVAGNAGKTAIFIFSGATQDKRPRIEITQGQNQVGATSGRLEKYLEVKVTDGRRSAVPGVAVQFATTATGAMFIPVPGTEVYGNSTALLNTLVTPLGPMNTATYTATATTPPKKGTPVFIQTDRSGLAKVYYELGTDTTQTTQTIEATLVGDPLTTIDRPTKKDFTARLGTAGSTRVANLEIVSGNPQSATKGKLLTNPLVVIARSTADYRIPNVVIQFRANTGTLSLHGLTEQPTFGTGPGQVPTGTPNPTSGQQIYVKTGSDGQASVNYNVGQLTVARDVIAEVRHEQQTGTQYDFAISQVTFNINGNTTTTTPPATTQPTQPTTPSLTISTAGEGATRKVTVTASDGVAVGVTLGGTALTTSQVVIAGTETTITLPTTPGTYTLTAAASGYTSAPSTSVTVPAATQTGTLSLSLVGDQVNGQQTIQVNVRTADNVLVSTPVTVTLSGAGISRTVATTNGTGRAIVALPATAGTLTASATGYTSGTLALPARTTSQTTPTTPTTPTPQPSPTHTPAASAEPDSIRISGPSMRSGPVNTKLEAPLLVRVLDETGDGVEDTRVIFRVKKGQGQLSRVGGSVRGNGRAVADRTDASGYLRMDYTPKSASSTVEAEASGLSEKVTFTITTDGAAPATGTTGTTSTTTQTAPVNPVLNAAVGAASRPPMLWISGGKIYALVGSEVKEFTQGVGNAISLAVGGNKLYWTEKTSEKQGTLNSANLDGTGAKELRKDPLWGVPRGIAVDTAGSKLYWVDAENRLQSSGLDGSGIQNVLRNLSDPQDLALANGNAYWTEAGGSVRFVNLTGTKNVRNISSGMDPVGSLAIAGGKVYWTEQVSETHGTLNVANLDGTGAKELRKDPLWGAPVGIAVDTARSNLYWTDAAGRLQRSKLDGTQIHNVAKGLGTVGDMVISNRITAPVATPSTKKTTAANTYDVTGDGSVDSKDVDAILVALAAGSTEAKYDVDGSGTVDLFDLIDLRGQVTAAAAAPTLLGMKFSAVQIQRLQMLIDQLIASGDRSPAALKTLIYLQQLIATARPEKTQLLANYPNPFNPETWIPYELATQTDVRLTIYNAQGVVIRVLHLGQQSAGYYTDRERAAYWDGRNSQGEQVASGVYFYQLETDEMSSLRKMVILK